MRCPARGGEPHAGRPAALIDRQRHQALELVVAQPGVAPEAQRLDELTPQRVDALVDCDEERSFLGAHGGGQRRLGLGHGRRRQRPRRRPAPREQAHRHPPQQEFTRLVHTLHTS